MGDELGRVVPSVPELLGVTSSPDPCRACVVAGAQGEWTLLVTPDGAWAEPLSGRDARVVSDDHLPKVAPTERQCNPEWTLVRLSTYRTWHPQLGQHGQRCAARAQRSGTTQRWAGDAVERSWTSEGRSVCFPYCKYGTAWYVWQ